MSVMPSWVSEAAEAVTAATDSAQMQTQLDTLTEAQRDLSVHLTRLSALKSATTSGGGTWFTSHNAPPEVFEALKAAARSPVQGTLGTLNRTLNPFVAAAEAKALADWRAYSEARLGAVSDLLQLAGTLSGVASVAPLATALAEVLRKLVPATNKLPAPGVFDLLAEAEARREALETALQPDSVRRFLSAVARGGAALDMLTEEVRAWLLVSRAERSFKIVAGSPVEG